MNLSITKRWERFLTEAVRTGRYESASEVVEEGLRLVEERDRKLAELRETIRKSIAEGGDHSDDDAASAIDLKTSEMAARGY